MQELEEIWQLVLGELAKKHSDTFMSLWINDLRLVSLDDSSAVFYIQSDFKRDMLEKKHSETISDTLEAVIGYKVDLYFTSDKATEVPKREPAAPASAPKQNFHREVSEPAPIIKQEPEKEHFSSEKEEPSGDTSPGIGDPPHWSDYTFDNFIVGSSNKFAYAACTAVAQKPAHAYNPLFIYGPSGLGKTHLLYAITNEVKRNDPNANVIYIKGEDFTNQMIESISRGTSKNFRELYRKADVLLIDDIHFIAGRDATQEEFFHTFNDLYEHKKQIILTSDRPARDIQRLEERLRTRFEWGLTTDIQPPDFELRIAIMKNKAETLGKTLSNEVLTLLAENLTNNIRQMEGAIKKLIAYSYLSGEEITVQTALTCISDLLSVNGPVKVTPEKIVSKVSEKYGVDQADIYTKKKTNDISRVRHICIYLMRKISDLSYPSIGNFLNRDHSTIMSSYRVIEREIKNNSAFEIEINELIKEITG